MHICDCRGKGIDVACSSRNMKRARFPHLILQYLRAHAGIDADEDDPVLVLGIGDDEGSAPLPNVDAGGILLRFGVPHLQPKGSKDRGETEREREGGGGEGERDTHYIFNGQLLLGQGAGAHHLHAGCRTGDVIPTRADVVS